MPALPGSAVPDTWTAAAAGRVAAGAPPMSPSARAAVKLLRPATSTVGTRRAPDPAAASEDGDGRREVKKLAKGNGVLQARKHSLRPTDLRSYDLWNFGHSSAKCPYLQHDIHQASTALS